MANFKGQKNAEESLAEAVRDTGTAVAEGFEKVKDWVKDQVGAKEPMSFARLDEIKPGMQVIASCDCILGTVDRMENGEFKLTRKDSPDGIHHFIPIQWVARVDDRVYLNKDAAEARHNWKSDVAFA